MSKLSNPTTSLITGSQESWLTKPQAAQLLGVAEKTIDRMAQAGELHKETLKRPGKVPIVVFHPGDVQRAKDARGPVAFVMPETSVQRVSDLEAGQVSTSASKVSRPPALDMSTSMSNLSTVPIKLWLTLREAVDYSGLPAGTLLEFMTCGRLPALDLGRRRGQPRRRGARVDGEHHDDGRNDRGHRAGRCRAHARRRRR